MLVIHNGIIAITRGDCGTINVNLRTANDENYEMDASDTLELTVRKLPSLDSPVLLHAVSAAGSNSIVLHKTDTMIEPGCYSADIQLNHGTDCCYTIWPKIDMTCDYMPNINRRNFIIATDVTATSGEVTA